MLLQHAKHVPSLLAPSKQRNPHTETMGMWQDNSLNVIKNTELIIIFSNMACNKWSWNENLAATGIYLWYLDNADHPNETSGFKNENRSRPGSYLCSHCFTFLLKVLCLPPSPLKNQPVPMLYRAAFPTFYHLPEEESGSVLLSPRN